MMLDKDEKRKQIDPWAVLIMVIGLYIPPLGQHTFHLRCGLSLTHVYLQVYDTGDSSNMTSNIHRHR
jgi:hypothetical protein